MKKCVKCGDDITERGSKYRYCILCSEISKKESIKKMKEKKEFKEKTSEYSKKYYQDNKDRLKPIRKNWRKNNIEKEKTYNKERYESTDKERLSNYYKENKDEINKKRSEYRKTDEYKKWITEYRLKNAHKQRYRNSLKSVIRRLGRNKTDYTNNLLGYSDLEFKLHIEKQFENNMSWEDSKTFEIDHIIPLSAFIDDAPLNIVSSLENLKPMNPSDNNKKYKSIDYNYISLYEKYIDYLNDDYKNKILNYLTSTKV